jgi:hypothetical protein
MNAVFSFEKSCCVWSSRTCTALAFAFAAFEMLGNVMTKSIENLGGMAHGVVLDEIM